MERKFYATRGEQQYEDVRGQSAYNVTQPHYRKQANQHGIKYHYADGSWFWQSKPWAKCSWGIDGRTWAIRNN